LLMWVFVYLCTQILVLTITQTKQMKKLFSLLFIAGAMSLVACGPSAEEKAKMEADAKAKMDSLFNAASQSVSTAMDSVKHDSAATPKMEEKK